MYLRRIAVLLLLHVLAEERVVRENLTASRNEILAYNKHILSNELEGCIALVLVLLCIHKAGGKTLRGIPTPRAPRRRATIVVDVCLVVPEDVRTLSLRQIIT